MRLASWFLGRSKVGVHWVRCHVVDLSTWLRQWPHAMALWVRGLSQANVFTQSIDASLSKTIGNGLYSILLGLAIRSVFTSSSLPAWPTVLYFVYLALVFYYVVDWLSFNILLRDAQNEMRHAWLLANVVAILAFGSAINFCPRLVDAEGLLTTETAWALDLFEVFLIAYVLLTTFGTFKALGPKTSWQRWDFGFRGYLATVTLTLALFRHSARPAPEASDVLLAYLLLIVLLVTGKVFRYEKDLLAQGPSPSEATSDA